MIITKTPFRISFVGGGTDIIDYYKVDYGAVISATINKYMYITVNKRFDDSIRVSYSKTEIVDDVDELWHEIVKECLKLVGIKKGIEITSISDIPAGTGLGSSSSFTVGLINALFSYTGDHLSAKQMAELACKVEIDILKHPIGKQDQYAAAYGGINFFQFNKDETVFEEKIKFIDEDYKKMNRKLMMFWTGISRSADKILEKQKKNTKVKIENLNFMRNQVYELRNIIKTEGFTKKFGEMLHEGWLKKKEITNGISSNQIDQKYELARQAGAVGGKILGAGGGGFLLLYCDEENQSKVRKAIGLKEMNFRIEKYGSRVVYFE